MSTSTITPTITIPPLLKGMEQTLGKPLLHQIISSQILLVGAGGIGCELMKNLALCGFTNIKVIDLDTIDVSNLNRQFLFRQSHVGMPKCVVACQAALEMSPIKEMCKYEAMHGNVCDNSRFNVGFMKQFDVVLNALDNVNARRMVNRLCLAASVPLVEAGTTGYLGQVTVIDKASGTECYECQAKPTQKVYPICTIRSTPSMPVHTIVWAKELYKLLFGPNVEDCMLYEDTSSDTEETSTYMDAVLELRKMIMEVKSVDEKVLRPLIEKVLMALYHTEIQKQLDMDRFKTAKKKPEPIPSDMITSICQDSSAIPPTKRATYKQDQIWSKQDCIMETVSCILDAATIVHSTTHELEPEFDKDDTLSMRFVTSTSNLRSYLFSIDPIQSYYSAKGIAGNIIPAIATTNAVVAGLQVLQTFHILRQVLEKKTGTLRETCRYIYCLRDKTRKGYYLQPTRLPDANPDCFVCNKGIINVGLDVTKWTFETFLQRIVKKELGFVEPSVMIGDSIIYEEGEDADVDAYQKNLPKKLEELPAGGVTYGSLLTIEDFTQDLEVEVCMEQLTEPQDSKEEVEKDEEEKFVVRGGKPVVASKAAAKSEENAAASDDDDDIEIVAPTNGHVSKEGAAAESRKRSNSDVIEIEDNPTKKAKM